MMAWRIAYCKINYPLAYYAAHFSIRASAFSYELMCQGQKQLRGCHDRIIRTGVISFPKKEQGTLKDMKIVQEMYARGFEFDANRYFSGTVPEASRSSTESSCRP